MQPFDALGTRDFTPVPIEESKPKKEQGEEKKGFSFGKFKISSGVDRRDEEGEKKVFSFGKFKISETEPKPKKEEGEEKKPSGFSFGKFKMSSGGEKKDEERRRKRRSQLSGTSDISARGDQKEEGEKKSLAPNESKGLSGSVHIPIYSSSDEKKEEVKKEEEGGKKASFSMFRKSEGSDNKRNEEKGEEKKGEEAAGEKARSKSEGKKRFSKLVSSFDAREKKEKTVNIPITSPEMNAEFESKSEKTEEKKRRFGMNGNSGELHGSFYDQRIGAGAVEDLELNRLSKKFGAMEAEEKAGRKFGTKFRRSAEKNTNNGSQEEDPNEGIAGVGGEHVPRENAAQRRKRLQAERKRNLAFFT